MPASALIFVDPTMPVDGEGCSLVRRLPHFNLWIGDLRTNKTAHQDNLLSLSSGKGGGGLDTRAPGSDTRTTDPGGAPQQPCRKI